MSDLTNEIMKKVRGGNVKKTPKSFFVLKRIFVWVSLVVAVVLAAFSLSMVIFQIVQVDWAILPRVAPGAGLRLFRLVPYFWLLVAFVIFVFVYFDFKQTRKGYRYSGGLIVIGSVIVSLFLAIVIHLLRAPEHFDKLFLRMPFYRGMHHQNELLWNAPDLGVVAGIVKGVELSGLDLEDFTGMKWRVNLERRQDVDFSKEAMRNGDPIKAIGRVLSPGIFEAEKIRPF